MDPQDMEKADWPRRLHLRGAADLFQHLADAELEKSITSFPRGEHAGLRSPTTSCTEEEKAPFKTTVFLVRHSGNFIWARAKSSTKTFTVFREAFSHEMENTCSAIGAILNHHPLQITLFSLSDVNKTISVCALLSKTRRVSAFRFVKSE